MQQIRNFYENEIQVCSNLKKTIGYSIVEFAKIHIFTASTMLYELGISTLVYVKIKLK